MVYKKSKSKMEKHKKGSVEKKNELKLPEIRSPVKKGTHKVKLSKIY
jgi:hypothetical protein